MTRKTYHEHYDLAKSIKRFDCKRRMQHEAMSRFAPSTVQECTTVLDCAGAEARQEIVRDAPPPTLLSHI